MDVSSLSASPFLPMVGWSAVLLAVHVMLQAFTMSAEAARTVGASWNPGPRDVDFKPSGKIAGRAARASGNFRETYPAFIALALALALRGDASGWGIGGAWLWFACRIVYIPLYLAGVPYVRSLAWVGSVLGLAAMFAALVS
ncbi:MAG: MAPEG family protein [Shinella zoogloeoides]|uniref:MAPEG family protein n=1 Tax=Shinella zoogloeoides TaxID=352475 RepID=UPI003C7958B2